MWELGNFVKVDRAIRYYLFFFQIDPSIPVNDYRKGVQKKQQQQQLTS